MWQGGQNISVHHLAACTVVGPTSLGEGTCVVLSIKAMAVQLVLCAPAPSALLAMAAFFVRLELSPRLRESVPLWRVESCVH